MGFLDRLLGREDDTNQQRSTQSYGQQLYGQQSYDVPPPPPQAPGRTAGRRERSEDEIAVERYQYLLRTAPPETIEQVHAEAFTKLTPEQRDLLFQKLTAETNETPADDSPDALARSATRAEMQQPGILNRAFGPGGQQGGRQGGPSFGSMVGGSLLGTVAGYVIGSAIVSSFLPMGGFGDASGADGGTDAAADASDGGGVDGSGADATDADAASADMGGADAGGWDGGGFDGGGDFGGGDFGGGDFGF